MRDPERYEELLRVQVIEVNPIFYVVEGDVEEWEKGAKRRVRDSKE